MRNEQAKKMLKAKLECLKRETSGTDFDCNNSNCDDCPLCYEQGHMWEQKEALQLAIKALEQEHCEDVISRAEAEAIFRNARSKLNPSDYKTADEFNTRDLMLLNAEQLIHMLPSVKPQEPKTGRWIFVDKAHEHAHCSECDYGNVDVLDGRPHNYCPNCGARMIEAQESEG